ncbi:MAG: quinone oxidoreductase family protein [Planctomycetota bacterium]|jgi:NADPH2:quinone reductase
MRAIIMNEFGGTDVLQLTDMPQPEAGTGDLLVEVHAAALNPVDTKIRKGLHGEKWFPLIPGYDVSGVVTAVGEGVTDFAVGDAVYASPSLARQGSNAEFVAVDARTAAHKPASLSHGEAAALPLVTLTAWEAMFDRADLKDGETIAISAGAGGVGHIAVQLAKARGCRVITTASAPESIELANACGADVVINYKTEDVVARVMAETEDAGCPIVFDTTGDPAFDQLLDCVAVQGRIVTIVLNENPRIVPALFRKNATLHCEFMGMATMMNVNPASQGAILKEAAAMVEAGTLKPHVFKTVGLEDIPAAHGEQEGEIVIKVKD